MSDAQATSPTGEVAQDQVADQASAPHDEPRDDEARGQEGAEEGEGQEAVVEEELELDVAGTKHKFKKGAPIDEALDVVQKYAKGLEASLTKKGQEIGEERKTLETQRKLTERLQSLKGEQLAMYARGEQVMSEINQLNQIDLNALWQSNPDQARRVSDRLGQLRHDYSTIYSSLAQYGNQLNQAERQEVEARAAEGEQAVAKAIKGWSPQVERELIEYAVKNGVPEQEAKTGWRLNPYATVTTWKALQYDKLIAKGTAATTTPATPASKTPVAPIKGGRGGNVSSPDLESMSMEQYAAYRRKQDSRSR